MVHGAELRRDRRSVVDGLRSAIVVRARRARRVARVGSRPPSEPSTLASLPESRSGRRCSPAAAAAAMFAFLSVSTASTDRVERVVDALGRRRRLRDQLLARRCSSVNGFICVMRHVDVRLDPRVGQVVLRLVEDRQRGHADRLLARDERLRVADRLRLLNERLLVVEVDPLDRGGALGRVRVRPNRRRACRRRGRRRSRSSRAGSVARP